MHSHSGAFIIGPTKLDSLCVSLSLAFILSGTILVHSTFLFVIRITHTMVQTILATFVPTVCVLQRSDMAEEILYKGKKSTRLFSLLLEDFQEKMNIGYFDSNNNRIHNKENKYFFGWSDQYIGLSWCIFTDGTARSYSLDLLGLLQLTEPCHALAHVQPAVVMPKPTPSLNEQSAANLRRSDDDECGGQLALEQSQRAPALPLLVLGTGEH